MDKKDWNKDDWSGHLHTLRRGEGWERYGDLHRWLDEHENGDTFRKDVGKAPQKDGSVMKVHMLRTESGPSNKKGSAYVYKEVIELDKDGSKD